ncbi:hypothetical protein B0T18DRAFT_326104 [Schizothecium vesticola]|uniref:Uncharacterized protein n=1 Tax=Schizothecium vesticola TaxID=314040 RepID=A0AA40EUI2_9PEZI|nr:hypothetical protein B0T18DRAFT_326104 [Schizothecium vesticola]
MKELVSQFDSTAYRAPESPLRNLRTISSQHVDRVRKELDGKRVLGTKARPLSEYQGRYWNSPRNYFVNVKQSEEEDSSHQRPLTMTADLLAERVYALEHCNYVTFS